jgi:two-component system, NtrC family, response regulator AtoC
VQVSHAGTQIADNVLTGLPPDDVIFGRSAAMRPIRDRIEKVAQANIPVLIRGERGSGKETIAKLIHVRSPRRGGPFVKVYCPSTSASLIDNPLFGGSAGFFGETTTRGQGRAGAAQGGTLFLDEIADLDTRLQDRVSHLLQADQVLRIGGPREMSVGMRVLCATHRCLERVMKRDASRPDFFYRINDKCIHLPPLRERREDIPVLADYFLRYYAAKYNRRVLPLSIQCLHRLQEYDWPGNIRELENLINSFLILDCERATLSEFMERLSGKPLINHKAERFIPLRKIAQEAAREAERKIILQVLEANNGNRKKAARALNLSYRALFYKIRGAGILPKRRLVPQAAPGPSPADCQSS